MTYFTRCNLLNKNPVKIAVFYKRTIRLSTGPLGKVKYYARRVEFQLRDSPNIHSFLWISNIVSLAEHTAEYYIEFTDSI